MNIATRFCVAIGDTDDTMRLWAMDLVGVKIWKNMVLSIATFRFIGLGI